MRQGDSNRTGRVADAAGSVASQIVTDRSVFGIVSLPMSNVSDELGFRYVDGRLQGQQRHMFLLSMRVGDVRMRFIRPGLELCQPF